MYKNDEIHLKTANKYMNMNPDTLFQLLGKDQEFSKMVLLPLCLLLEDYKCKTFFLQSCIR